MKVVFTVLLFLLMSCKSTGVLIKDIDVIDKQEKWGIILYERGDYAGAFNNLSELAAWGYKDSQYALAFMFFKGQHVKQSTLIGMGWLGVAVESGIKEWEELFHNMYAAASITDKTKFDLIIQDYKSKFGSKAQNVSCIKTITSMSKRVITQCSKSDELTNVFSIDLTEEDLKSYKF